MSDIDTEQQRSSASTAPIAPVEHRVRLLLPFWMRRDSVEDAVKALMEPRHQERAVWEIPSQEKNTGGRPIVDAYLAESLPATGEFLFGQREGGCRYLRVPAGTANAWFRNGGIFSADPEKTSSDKSGLVSTRRRDFRVKLAGEGIELILSPHGVGALSITLQLEKPGDLKYLQSFNYRLSQMRDRTQWRFHLPASPQSPSPPPGANASFERRLGASGGWVSLPELAGFLIAPLHCFGLQRPQEQFSIYAVTRFGKNVDFTEPAAAEPLRRFLAALTHIEEPDHVGSLAVTERLLNPNHWAAVGSLGAAHLVSDQDPSHPYDAQRLSTVYRKYFVPYLVSLLQRLTLQRLLHEAADVVGRKNPSGGEQPHQLLKSLHEQMLRFTVQGYFTELSSREVLNQYYELAQKGLRVPESLRVAQRALHDLEVTAGAGFQRDITKEMGVNVKTVAEVQSKVEWLEVFFVSYYATALTYYISAKGIFSHGYAQWSMMAVPLISGVIAFFGIRPDTLHEHSQSHGAYGFLIALVMLFIAWVGFGLLLFPNSAETH